ncbi:MAG: GTPase Era [Parvularculaceae bacterium]|nr:GTPase Era [Parvularculaceae bacterium]
MTGTEAKEGAAPDARRCAVVALIGAPNAGKSSLVNALVGAKVSIVTHKVQTTRARIRGVLVEDAVQLVFIDTPGIFEPKRRLDRAMVSAAWGALDGADALVLIVDAPSYLAGGGDGRADAAARRAAADTDRIVAALAERKKKAILALNKLDAMPRERLLSLIARFDAVGVFSETFLVSAVRGDGLGDLKARLKSLAPTGNWLYPDDQLSDLSDRLMAAEVTREKLFLRLHDEIPYEATVETEAWTRTAKGELRVEQTIYVAREGQKKIAIGEGGQTLKAIGAAARAELAEMLGETVHLFLHVKVRDGWLDEAARLRAIGLDVVD